MSYFEETQRPLPSLVFVAPLLVIYEFGVIWVADRDSTGLRNGADAWMRWGLERAGISPAFVLPIIIFTIFLIWQAWTKQPWRCDGEVVLGMVGESIVLALALMVIGRLQDLAFSGFENGFIVSAIDLGEPPESLGDIVAYLGAGIYEETLFRLMLMPASFGLLRLVGVPSSIATTIVLSLSAITFSFAHYLGPTAEPFEWFSFIFRWVAGLFFATVFVLRGFGVAVGAHAAYDLLIGFFQFEL